MKIETTFNVGDTIFAIFEQSEKPLVDIAKVVEVSFSVRKEEGPATKYMAKRSDGTYFSISEVAGEIEADYVDNDYKRHFAKVFASRAFALDFAKELVASTKDVQILLENAHD